MNSSLLKHNVAGPLGKGLFSPSDTIFLNYMDRKQ